MTILFSLGTLIPLRSASADTRSCTKIEGGSFDWLGNTGTYTVRIQNDYITTENRNIGSLEISAPIGGPVLPFILMETSITAQTNGFGGPSVFTANFDYTQSPPNDFSTSDGNVRWQGTPQRLTWNIVGVGQITNIVTSHRWHYDDGVWYDRAPTGFTNFATLDCLGYAVDPCPTASLTSNPPSIAAGGTSLLQWNISNLGNHHFRIPGTTISDSTTTTGSVGVSPVATTTYTLEFFDPLTGATVAACSLNTIVTVNSGTETWRWRINRNDPIGGMTPGYVYPPFSTYTLSTFEVTRGENAGEKEPYRQQALDETARLSDLDHDTSNPASLAGQYTQKYTLWQNQQSQEWIEANAQYNAALQDYYRNLGQFQAAHQTWQEANAAWEALYGGSTPGSTVISPILDPSTGQPIRPKSVFDLRNRQIPRRSN